MFWLPPLLSTPVLLSIVNIFGAGVDVLNIVTVPKLHCKPTWFWLAIGLEFKPVIVFIGLPSLKAIVTPVGLPQLVIVGSTFVKFALILKKVVSRPLELDASKITLTVIT